MRPNEHDERVALFLQLADGVQISDDLVSRIRLAIRTNLSARHVPTWILECPEIPVGRLLYESISLVYNKWQKGRVGR